MYKQYNLEEIREQLSRDTLYGDAMSVAKFLLGLLDEAYEQLDDIYQDALDRKFD